MTSDSVRDPSIASSAALGSRPGTAVLVTTGTDGELRVFDLSGHRDGARILDDVDANVEPEDVRGTAVSLLASGLLRRLSVPSWGPAEDDWQQLSARELEILGLVAEGRLNREIAQELFLSPNTIKSYIRSAYRKIGAQHRGQAIRWALRHPGVAPGTDPGGRPRLVPDQAMTASAPCSTSTTAGAPVRSGSAPSASPSPPTGT